jgi:TfoX/Sxy family transcriptional regulator of competence genes
MATSREHAEYVREKLNQIGDFSLRPMMGEYIVYYQGKVIGGLYDYNILLKQTKVTKKYIEDIQLVIPYPGAKPMVMVDLEVCHTLKPLFEEMYLELPFPKGKKK